MTDAALETAVKIVLITGFVAISARVAHYTRMVPWWKNMVGRTLVAELLLLAATFICVALPMFVHLSPRNSDIVGWVDVMLIGAVTPTMLWQIMVHERLDRAGRRHSEPVPGSGHDNEGEA